MASLLSIPCRICGKELIDPESVKDGIGPICKAKLEKYENFEAQTELAEVNVTEKQLAEIEDVQDVRKLIAMADGYLSVARRTYSATKNVAETKEDSERAYNIGVKAAELRLRAEARLGELIREMQERGELASQDTGNRNLSNTTVTLNDIGLSKIESSRFQQVADAKERIPEIVRKAIMENDFPTRKALLTTPNVHVSNNTGNYEWYTPKSIMILVRKLFYKIDLDPASSDIANRLVQAETYYTIKENGLNQPWFGKVWMNPPYSQPLVQQFCNLLVEKFKQKEIDEACVLVNNATETAFYQNMLQYCRAVCFIKSRVKFVDQNGESTGAPLQGQTILYFGENEKLFGMIFSEIGVILYA